MQTTGALLLAVTDENQIDRLQRLRLGKPFRAVRIAEPRIGEDALAVRQADDERGVTEPGNREHRSSTL
jgi:hypothetical protein